MHQRKLNSRFFRGFFLRWALLFTVLFPLSFPFERGGILPDPGAYTQVLFEKLARFTGETLFHLPGASSMALVSDTAGFYLNAFNLLLLTLVAAFIWMRVSKTHSGTIAFWLTTLVRYYLALQMFWYGFDKIFKVQFYLPEPNTLFTLLGHTQKDLLYWSTMGSSYTYTFFTGCTELLAAILLLFNRTALAGTFIAAGIMTNVVMINIGFDISVKLYSCFLLLLCCVVIGLHLHALYRFFVLQVPAVIKTWRPGFLQKHKIVYRLVKISVIVLMLADALAPFVRAGNYNDDVFPRPFLHGAYTVQTYSVNRRTLDPDLRNRQRWKRFFVHRRGYFIVQYMNDEMADFAMEYDTLHHTLWMTDYDSARYAFRYTVLENGLQLEGIVKRDTLRAKGKKIDLHQLPLLQNEFGWTIHE